MKEKINLSVSSFKIHENQFDSINKIRKLSFFSEEHVLYCKNRKTLAVVKVKLMFTGCSNHIVFYLYRATKAGGHIKMCDSCTAKNVKTYLFYSP